MCVATAVVVGASVAGTYASAKIASNASKNAANTQAQAGRDAMGVQQNMYQQQQQQLAPFRDAGVTALGRLNQFQTFNGVPAGPRGLGAGMNPQPGDPSTVLRAGGVAGGVFGPQLTGTGGESASNLPAYNRYGGGAALGMPSGPNPPPTAPPPGPAPNGPGPLVMMRAPDGSTQQVPAEQVPHFQSRGAQVIG